ncbi:MAG: hypothetical protein JWN44_1183 [Myxococcales bacterium]|nr:hypothetical protein [Myxococcales bacterium]
MSDVGKLERSTPAAESSDLAKTQDIPASALADREQIGDELAYRATGGRGGVAPMQRLMDQRRSVGSDLSRRVQRKADEGAKGGEANIPQGGGSALSPQLRQRFEPKLGADLADVRVHTGGESASAAAGIKARAFTVGSDVHFNAGEYAPGSKEGDRLLAHELTHVVQGKNSGIQRKAEGDEHGTDGKHEGAEVSHPDEPAEKEADAVGDEIADSLHAKEGEKDAKGKGKEKDKGKSKGKDKEKDKDKQGAKGDDSDGGHDHGDEHGGGGDHGPEAHEAGGAGGGGGAHGAEAKGGGGDKGGGAAKPEEKPAPISAKFIGVGRKIFRAPTPPASSSAPAPGPGAKPGVNPAKQAQIDKAKACKTPAEVDTFCKSDPIAAQKLKDVNAETNLEGGNNDGARTGFYSALSTWIQSNAETLNPATIFNSCMNSLATPWKFKGTKLAISKLPKAMQRTQGLKGFWYNAVDQAYYKNLATGAPNPEKAAYDLWKQDATSGKPLEHRNAGGVISPEGGTWFTPDSYKLTNASDAGYGQLLELAALQPEWFPEGNIAFEVDVKAAGSMEARKPTAYDGMQSSLWVSRPTGDSFGVTGGGAQEFLGSKVPVASIKSARAVIPSADTLQQLSDAVRGARDLALAADPELKKKIDSATDPKIKKGYEDMIPNLTDMFIRGTATMPMGATVKQMLEQIRNVTAAERAAPSPARPSGEITAPSAGGAKPAPNASAGGSSSTPGAGGSAPGPRRT